LDSNTRQRDAQQPRGLSPVPPGFFKTQALCILTNLWHLRLCPGRAAVEIREVLEEVNRELPATDHMLLCIGSWQFQCRLSESEWSTQCDPSELDWEFYRFTFHESLETENEELFASIKRCWNNYTGENITTEDVTQLWRNMNVNSSIHPVLFNDANDAWWLGGNR
jgi:hypothetical protein